MEKLLLKALSHKTCNIPPIWLMRQAGRYLPEYRERRADAGSFLNLCYNPEFASEVTLQPIERFSFDASIIFSDILVIPHAMGVDLDYKEGEGPVLGKIDSAEKIKNLKLDEIEEKLKPVFEAISLTKSKLPEHTAMIGFAGSPWTVATYMVEGGGSKDFANVKKFAYENRKIFEELLDKLVDATSRYLVKQVEAGAEVLQIFDSWAGVLPEEEFYDFVIKPTIKIIENVRAKCPDTPIIGFPKGAGVLYEDFVKETGVEGLSIDFTVPLKWAKENLQPHACLQGNLDPILLGANTGEFEQRAKNIINILGGGPFIFNLGHGILPHTPIENVERLIEIVRGEKEIRKTG